jgi:hypothetical protein
VSDRVVVMRLRTGQDILEYEIRQEQAATIGRLARELQYALDALDAFNRMRKKSVYWFQISGIIHSA